MLWASVFWTAHCRISLLQTIVLVKGVRQAGVNTVHSLLSIHLDWLHNPNFPFISLYRWKFKDGNQENECEDDDHGSDFDFDWEVEQHLPQPNQVKAGNNNNL